MKSILKHSKLIIVLTFVVTVALGLQIRHLKLDNNTKQFFPQRDVSYQRLEDTRDIFGSMISIGISLETKKKSILTPEYIEVIRKISERLETVPEVDEVTSLTSIDYVEGRDGALVAEPILTDDYTGSPEDIEKIAIKLDNWESMYSRVVLSDDWRACQFQLSIHDPSNAEQKETGITASEVQQSALRAVEKIVYEEVEGHDLEVRLYGEPVLSDEAQTFIISDLIRLIPLVALVVLVSLFFSFHTLDGTILPLICVLIATIWSCGLMAIFHVTFTLVSSVIPVALIACGSAYGIHVLTHYYIAIDELKSKIGPEEKITKEMHLDAVCKGLKDVRLALILSAVTTVAGFISLVSSPLVPLSSFSIFTALGVAFSLELSALLIPSLLLQKSPEKIGYKSKHAAAISEILKEHVKKRFRRGENKGSTGSTLYNLFHIFAGTAPRLIIFTLVIVVFSAVGLSKLRVDTSNVGYFPSTCNFRKNVDYANERFAGTNSVYFVVQSPAGLKKAEGDVFANEALKIREAAEKNGVELTAEENAKVEDLMAKANEKFDEARTLPDMTNPEILKKMDDFEEYLMMQHNNIGKVVSFGTFIKRMNQVLHTPSEEEIADQTAQDASASDDLLMDDFGFGDLGFDDFGPVETEAESAAEVSSDFVDPNIRYKEMLHQPMKLEEFLRLMNVAYVKAGAQNATVNNFVDSLLAEFNYDGWAYDEIPYDTTKYPVAKREDLKDLISQYLLLFSGSLDRFVDDPLAPKTARTLVQLRNFNTTATGVIIADAREYIEKYFPEGYKVYETGTGEMEYVMTDLVVKSQLTSLVTSLVLVFIIISISFHSPLAGIIGAIPLALTIILNYMVMGFFGINLDLITSIIASVAIGVGIDYTIHFMSTYRDERRNSDDIENVTKATFRKSGVGIVTNAIAVGLGFLVLCFSNFVVLRCIGILIAIVMLTSSSLAMTIIPGLFNALDPKFLKKKDKSGEKAEKSESEENK